ncbi:MAG: hypothetical protein IJM52_08565, partial [Spirochaetales bacterium]|nr:hypothetical protein [Spirochaetales bacterium]
MVTAFLKIICSNNGIVWLDIAIMICIILGCWAAVAFCAEAAADVSMDALMNGVNQIIAVALP